uniref:Uncharacterized protein n=1 Tax=Rhizophora mucronata TaxID=61149 RepID=A0A2P2NBU6_RHIMU
MVNITGAFVLMDCLQTQLVPTLGKSICRVN